jgi:addiction module HigA family antidote
MANGGCALYGQAVTLPALKLSITTKRSATMPRTVPLIHPGVILLEDWLKPLGISQYALAKAIDVPPRRINEIVKGLRGITVDSALRLGAFFGTDAQSWVNLQTHYDTEQARTAMADVLGRIVRLEATEA